jgi:hypothetical protein
MVSKGSELRPAWPFASLTTGLPNPIASCEKTVTGALAVAPLRQGSHRTRCLPSVN